MQNYSQDFRMVSQNQRHRMFDIRKNVEIQIVNIYRHVQ